MKVVILAGGFGTRLSEHTHLIPKPMVLIGGIPILVHIMNLYAHYGFNDFYLALGYKSEIIKDFFLNFNALQSDFTVDLSTGNVVFHRKNSMDWRVTLVDTGQSSMTGGRLKRLKEFIGDDVFMLTYGDGLSDINIMRLLDFHYSHGKMVTISAVRPPARFGELEIEGSHVLNFQEKPQMEGGWINGGFFVVNPTFLDFLKDDSTVLEREPLELIASAGELMAFKHYGFWQCMDTKRDLDKLQSIWDSGSAPWNL